MQAVSTTTKVGWRLKDCFFGSKRKLSQDSFPGVCLGVGESTGGDRDQNLFQGDPQEN